MNESPTGSKERPGQSASVSTPSRLSPRSSLAAEGSVESQPAMDPAFENLGEILDKFGERLAAALAGARAAVPVPLTEEQLKIIEDYGELGKVLQGPDVDPPDELNIGPDVQPNWTTKPEAPGGWEGFAKPLSVDPVKGAPQAGTPIV